MPIDAVGQACASKTNTQLDIFLFSILAPAIDYPYALKKAISLHNSAMPYFGVVLLSD